MRKTLTRLALAGAAVTVLAAGTAMAQIPPPPPPAGPAGPAAPMPFMDAMTAMGPSMGDMMFMHHGLRADPEKRAQRLRDVLQLRPDQDPALKAYVEATAPKMVIHKEQISKDKLDKPGSDKKDSDKMEWAEAKPPTTLERLDHMTKAADAMKARAEATRAFYTALTPSQQKTFDVLGLGEGAGGDDHVFIRRFDTRAPIAKDGERKVIIQRKVG